MTSLRDELIRNINEVALERQQRDPLYDTRCGDVITIPPGPEYPHQIINTSDALPKFLSISTRECPGICFYPDSGTFGAFHFGTQLMQRPEANLHHWDGEP